MKMKCQSEKPKVFQTLIITIKIESLDELKALWHRFNVPASFMSNTENYPHQQLSNYQQMGMWNMIDNELTKY
jgi:hypothetical protein